LRLKVLYSGQIADNPSKSIRILEPLHRLTAAGLVETGRIEDADGGVLTGCDILFLHLVDLNAGSAAVLVPKLNQALSSGAALICDTDDPYFIPADGCGFEDRLAPHHEQMKGLLSSCHLLTVTTPALKEALQIYARSVAVIPNLIDLKGAPRVQGGHEHVRIGWCGGPTHTDDLTFFLPVVAKLQARVPVDFVIFGMFDENFEETVAQARKVPASRRKSDPALAAFGWMAEALGGVKYRHFPSVPFGEFPRKLAELSFDIGVCPLLDTPFNRCRSAVKFYQYAAAGIVTVASDGIPYRGECSLLAQNSVDSWVEQLSPLIEDPVRRRSELARQRAFVRANRSWEVGLPLYLEVFKGIGDAVRRSRSV
jgi:processive 1,2-diacylglycerol beta-glucosyltransferase